MRNGDEIELTTELKEKIQKFKERLMPTQDKMKKAVVMDWIFIYEVIDAYFSKNQNNFFTSCLRQIPLKEIMFILDLQEGYLSPNNEIEFLDLSDQKSDNSSAFSFNLFDDAASSNSYFSDTIQRNLQIVDSCEFSQKLMTLTNLILKIIVGKRKVEKSFDLKKELKKKNSFSTYFAFRYHLFKLFLMLTAKKVENEKKKSMNTMMKIMYLSESETPFSYRMLSAKVMMKKTILHLCDLGLCSNFCKQRYWEEYDQKMKK